MGKTRTGWGLAAVVVGGEQAQSKTVISGRLGGSAGQGSDL